MQRLLLALCIAMGLLIGAWVVRGRASDAGQREGLGAYPSIELRAATTGALRAAGFRLSGKEPTSWSAIDLAMHGDAAGESLFLHCLIDASEVDGLTAFAQHSWRTGDDAPPPTWRELSASRAYSSSRAVPAWWQPAAQRSRVHDVFQGNVRAGLYAGYDPPSRRLWLWRWTLRDAIMPEPRAAALDAVALHLARALGSTPSDSAGWVHGAGLAVPMISAQCRVDASLRARAGRHRIVLRMQPISASAALQWISDVPVRSDAADSPAPEWSFALPNGARPALLDVGAGPRWRYDALRVGDGRAEAGRWAAYDAAAQALVVWDWSGVE